MSDEWWPFGDDADRDDPLAELRIPVVGSPHPRWKYEVCLVIGKPGGFGPDGLYGSALRPDEREVQQILAELDYRMDYYNEGWKAKMRRRALDVDSSTNTVVLLKRAPGNWCYRRMSWQTEPLMVPAPGMAPEDLETVLDRINDFAPEKWAAWKARYPGVFG